MTEYSKYAPQAISCIAAFVLILCAVVKAAHGKKTDVKPSGCSFWWLVIISSIGSLMLSLWISKFFADAPRMHYFFGFSAFREFARYLLIFAFFIAAIAALSEKRALCIVSSILLSAGVLLLTVLRLFSNRVYYGSIAFGFFDLINLSVRAFISLVLAVVVIWQYKARKVFSQVVWPVLMVICLMSVYFQPLYFGYYWVNLALIAMFFWLSPKSEKKLTLPKIELPKTSKNSAKPNASPTDTADKLKALETLQGLLNNGAITQEEFDAKKKQLLGL